MTMYNLFIIDQERCSLNINQPSDSVRLEQRLLFLPAGVTASLTYVYTASWTFQLASFCFIVYAAQRMRWRDRRWPSPPLRVVAVADRTSRKTTNEGDSWRLVPYAICLVPLDERLVVQVADVCTRRRRPPPPPSSVSASPRARAMPCRDCPARPSTCDRRARPPPPLLPPPRSRRTRPSRCSTGPAPLVAAPR
jgi:hypothetical protein